MVECPSCGSSDDLELVEELDDGRRRLRCSACGHLWDRGEPKRVYKTATTLHDLKRSFPSPDDVEPKTLERVARLKTRFLANHPTVDPRVVQFQEDYRRLFSAGGLETATPTELKYFANANLGASPGNMSVFNREWNRLGPDEAAAQVKESIAYLLRGPENTYIEDRLTNLIVGYRGMGMKGFREALLTKVLSMAFPQDWLSIVTYTGKAGKKQIAERLYGLRLPDPDSVSWTIGRLIFWSNQLLIELVGDGFVDTEHKSWFLSWTENQAE